MRIQSLMATLGIAVRVGGCSPMDAAREANARMLAETGLQSENADPDGMGGSLVKVHRGYPVRITTRMGNVWGRYAARLAAGEIGREVGGIMAFLTGQGEYIGNVAGSPLDRLLSRIIGQPLSLVVAPRHGKESAPRLDIVSDHATIGPDDRLPFHSRLGVLEEQVFTEDRRFADRLLANPAFRDIVANFRAEYIRVDEYGVTFMFAGSENDYSGMIREFGSYSNFLNGIMDALAAVADTVEK